MLEFGPAMEWVSSDDVRISAEEEASREFTLNCTRKPISHESRSDECEIGFQVQFNVEFTSQVMDFP